MRPRLTDPSIRRNLTLLTRDNANLDYLREYTDSSSDSEVIRLSLMYYEELLYLRKNNKYVCINENKKRMHITFDPNELDPIDNSAIKRNILLSVASNIRINRIRSLIEHKNDSSVVRVAIYLLDYFVRQYKNGHRFYLVENEGQNETIERIKFFGFPSNERF